MKTPPERAAPVMKPNASAYCLTAAAGLAALDFFIFLTFLVLASAEVEITAKGMARTAAEMMAEISFFIWVLTLEEMSLQRAAPQL